MRTHGISSTQNRSSADAHRGNGISLPAAQLFAQHPQYATHNLSDNGRLMVGNTGKPDRFLAHNNAALAENVLKAGGVAPNGMTKYRTNVDYINDCGVFANRILEKIHGFDEDTQSHFKTIKGTDDKLPQDVTTLFTEEVFQGPVNPQLNEVYLGVSDPKSWKVKNYTHYNFHWAAVVAQDGSDVITVEAAPHQGQEWFWMYNHAKQGQTFRERYVTTLDKMSQSAKFFAATFHTQEKQKEFGGYISD